MASLTVNYTALFGTSVRIGYKIVASVGDYTYLNVFPTYNQSPFTIAGLPVGNYQVQINTVCTACGGTPIFSDPTIITAVTGS
jgi:hypothetical protein